MLRKYYSAIMIFIALIFALMINPLCGNGQDSSSNDEASIFGTENNTENPATNEEDTADRVECSYPGRMFYPMLSITSEALNLRSSDGFEEQYIVDRLSDMDQLEFINVARESSYYFEHNYFIHVKQVNADPQREGYVWGQYVSGPAMDTFQCLPLWNYVWYVQEEVENMDLIRFFKAIPSNFKCNMEDGSVKQIIPPKTWEYRLQRLDFIDEYNMKIKLKRFLPDGYYDFFDYPITWTDENHFTMPVLPNDGELYDVNYIGFNLEPDEVVFNAELEYHNDIIGDFIGDISGNGTLSLSDNNEFTFAGLSEEYNGTGKFFVHPCLADAETDERIPIIALSYNLRVSGNIVMRFYRVVNLAQTKVFRIDIDGNNISLTQGSCDPDTYVFTDMEGGLQWQGNVQ